jgi:hypothetical protein
VLSTCIAKATYLETNKTPYNLKWMEYFLEEFNCHVTLFVD